MEINLTPVLDNQMLVRFTIADYMIYDVRLDLRFLIEGISYYLKSTIQSYILHHVI